MLLLEKTMVDLNGEYPYIIVINNGFSYIFIRRKEYYKFNQYNFEHTLTLNQDLPIWLSSAVKNYMLMKLKIDLNDLHKLDKIVCLSCSLCTFPLVALSLKKQNFYPVDAHQVY